MIEKNDKNKNTSIVDEFNRNKRLFYKMKFKEKNIDYLWKCFLETFKQTFKIKRNLELGLEFGLKIGGVYSKYEVETLDVSKKTIQIKWNNQDDKYWLKFQVRKKYIGTGSIIKATEHIYRSTPFWGLQDTAGMMWMKKTFKNEMKRIRQSTKIVLDNDGSIPNDLTNLKTIKEIRTSFKLQENDFDFLIKTLQSYFKTNFLLEKGNSFTSKINKYSIVYKIHDFSKENGYISFEWKQESDNYLLMFLKKNSKFDVLLSIDSILDINWKRKMKLIKSNIKEMIKEIKMSQHK